MGSIALNIANYLNFYFVFAFGWLQCHALCPVITKACVPEK